MRENVVDYLNSAKKVFLEDLVLGNHKDNYKYLSPDIQEKIDKYYNRLVCFRKYGETNKRLIKSQHRKGRR